MFLDWLERRIDPFASFEDGRMPPKTVTGFAAFYLRPMRTALVMLFLVAVAAGTVEASLYLLMGWFIDLLNNADRATILQDHGWKLGLAAMLLLVVRPFTIWLHEVMSNQLLVPQATNQVRWRTHLYTLGHSLSYFQADFAGRLANRVVQVGPAVRELAVVFIDTLLYVAIYAVTAVGPVRLHLVMDGPAGGPMGGGLFGADLVVRAPCPSALPRDGRHAVDSHRADRRQLHQHPHGEALRPRPGRTRGRA